MIIREIELVNIRSHHHSVVSFPLGRTLLEGDIGSGKSSVLMGIEFALFGLGADSGASVLKMGEDSGEVRMKFEVGGALYEITRRLQRKQGRVQQSGGELKVPGETLILSPSELKEKVLEILEFNEAPDPKARSWIYRYAVYTPQEEMKQILSLAPEQRLQILRRAFRVEDYKTASTNAEDAIREMREDAREQDGIARGAEELRRQTERLQAEETGYKTDLAGLEDEANEAEKQVRRLKEEREDLQRREVSLQRARSEKEYYARLESDARRDAGELETELAELGAELKTAEAALETPELERPSAVASLAELKRKERSLEVKARKLAELKAGVESKLSDYESIMKNGVCPVCDRPAEAHDFGDRKARKDAERRHLVEELAKAEEEAEEARRRIEKAEAYKDALKELALQKSQRLKLKGSIERKEQAKRKFEKRADFAKNTLSQLGRQLEELRDLAQAVTAANGRLTASEERLRRASEKLVRTRGALEAVQKRQTEVAIETVAKEEAANRSRKLREREIWLRDYFVPTVQAIEKSVLATINQEFDVLFEKWFGMLVRDPDKEVGIDEDFTPAVTQGGYEQDVEYLSGGERTSIALAYRLALNVLAQRVSVGMKSNLLILDEPTDGFSKEQLGTVREVLDDVGCPQVVIVSHDKELESFADQIFRVEKTGSESSVKMP